MNNDHEIVDDAAKAVRKAKNRVNYEWGWRVLVLVGLACNLWLNKNYVSRDDYKEDSRVRATLDARRDEQIRLISDTLIEMKVQTGINATVDKKLDDHELRLRSLEMFKRDK